MFKVGDRVRVVSDNGHLGECGTVMENLWQGFWRVMLDSKERPYLFVTRSLEPIQNSPIPNEDIMLDEFDEGGLKKMPDGALESVHIPEDDGDSYKTVPLKKTGEVYLISKKKKEEAMIPYTATGTGGPPKPKPPVLEWRVAACITRRPAIEIGLMVDGVLFRSCILARPDVGKTTARQERKLAKRIAEAKESILRLYRLTLRESGRVE